MWDSRVYDVHIDHGPKSSEKLNEAKRQSDQNQSASDEATLDLSMSQFQGGVPYELGNLSMLTVLDINNGRWKTDYPVKSLHWLPGLPFLQHLDMSCHDLGSASDWLQMINTLPSFIELH
ncbi:Leucine-rich repeat-containing protein [Artemisia annua]|uniref:Leucine-rich repeat-containing protein n=1 Tax=Artemisia annua TaxID=35608 RepID=A0A2U1LB89_ARTAN|nr:Leucine-rich repeat-containing protein [Artemisia annua]